MNDADREKKETLYCFLRYYNATNVNFSIFKVVNLKPIKGELDGKIMC